MAVTKLRFARSCLHGMLWVFKCNLETNRQFIMTCMRLDFLKVARSLLIEWTWHERLLSLAARQIYRRNFPPVALSNQKQRYESTRQSRQIITRSREQGRQLSDCDDETGNLFSSILAIVCISVFAGPRTSKLLVLIMRPLNDAIAYGLKKQSTGMSGNTSAK